VNNIIIGTAGHVDHGKTMLIRALTGIETDRLKEEKKRGITIELGFAHLKLPNGEQAGIVDVPGHEKFVKNMLAGAGGMDLVLLVVAADEGFMPQTREHLGILSLLDVREGIVVITKADMVEEDWLEAVREEVAEEVKGTFLEHAPVMPVSAVTGMGIEELKAQIFASIQKAQGKNTRAPARIPVDRVFSVDGFGTVITGTMLEGAVSEGDELTIYPRGEQVKVRNLQVHNKTVPTAYAGQRTAINLAGIKKTDIQRGDTLAKPDSMEVSLMVDVRLNILKDCERPIENGSRLHFYHGTRDVLCKLVLLEQDALTAGESGYAQLRFHEPVATKKGDHFVVRFYSPVETVGGGIILDGNAQRHKRLDASVIDGLKVKESGSLGDRVSQLLLELSPQLPTVDGVAKQLGLSQEELTGELDELCREEICVRLTEKYTFHSQYLQTLWNKLEEILAAYHRANPLQIGMKKEELRGKLFSSKDAALIDAVLEQFLKENRIKLQEGRLSLLDFMVTYTPAQKKLLDQVVNTYLTAGYNVPGSDEVIAAHPKEKELCKQIFEALSADGTLVMVAPQLYLHQKFYGEALEKLTGYLSGHDTITLGDFRDLLGTSRKYAVALLEFWDRRGVTQKVGDARVLCK